MNGILRRLISEVKPHKKGLTIVAITGMLWAVAYSRLGLIVRDIQNSFETGKADRIEQTALHVVCLALIVAVSRYFHIFTMNMISERVVNDLRLRMQSKFMRLSLGFHSTFASGSGGLMSRIINDIKVIQDGYRMLADLFREPLFAVLLLGNLFWLNWQLTATIIVVLPLVMWFLRQVSRSLRKYVKSGQEDLERITSTVKESLDGVRTIQSFNLEPTMSEKLRQQSAGYLQIRSRVHSRIEAMGPITEFIATFIVLGIFFYFGAMTTKGTYSTGDVLAYITSMMMINAPLKKLQESYVRIQETMIAAQRTYSILDVDGEVPDNGARLPFPQDWRKIVYRKVSFSYGDEGTLTDIDLEIKRGEQIALVGESGSGKSTLVNLLERFHDPTSGEILIDDIPIRDIDLTDLRRHIALVSQDVFLFSDTLRSNIRAGDFTTDSAKVEEAARLANATPFVSRLAQGLDSQAGDRGNLLSGGEKQRISIARAMFKDAPILVLDEATSALDSASEREVQKGLDQLLKGRTSLVIAHRLSTVQNADRIVVLKKGRIVEIGHHVELLERGGEYARFHRLQNQS